MGLGVPRRGQGDRLAALSEIEKLEARYAENPDGRYFAPLADAYRKGGRVDEAIVVVTSGLAKHPDYLSAHIVLGRCFLEKKDDASALKAFERVLGLDGENIIALKSLAEISERTGDTASARRWLGRLLVVDAMNAEAAEDLARLGGPLPEDGAGAAADPEPETSPHISFMDLNAPEEPAAPAIAFAETVPTAAIDVPEVPRTIERAAVKWPPPAPPPPPEPAPAPEPPMLQMDPIPESGLSTEAVPALELESTAFVPPSPDEVPAAPGGEFQPFDDQLAWGAGDRQSGAVRAEDIAAAEAKHEPTASAIDFMGGASGASEPPAPADPDLATVPMDRVPPPSGWTETPTREIAPISVEPPAEVAAPVPAATELSLIMPEDVTPADEMRRPSSKLVQLVSPEPDAAPDASGELMVTETMGDLYLRQGMRDRAAEVYRRLLVARPDDHGLKAKLAAIESPRALSAAAQGSEAVGPWLRRIAKAQLPTPAPVPPPAPEAGATPMEQAFSAPEPEPAAPAAPTPVPVDEAAPTPGAPARPATDQYSLDQIFGGQQQGGRASKSQPPPAHTLGASFDEFFGAAPKAETVRPKEGGPGGRQSEDDLSAFNAWLHGLKR